MQLRPMTSTDLADLAEIDATIESTEYLHLQREDDAERETLSASWSLEPRELRDKLIKANPPGDDLEFTYKQVIAGVLEGMAWAAEHDGLPVASLLAEPRAERGLLEIVDLRVDYDHRRQGLASALIFQAVTAARESDLRALLAHTTANMQSANALLAKVGFDLAGLDERRFTNHDVVKEQATLIWYLALSE
ncbi:MAG: GNAT family N-acetyltransferase [Planctomycetota bacterium]